MRLILTAFLLLSTTLPVLAADGPIYVVRPPGAIAKAGAVLPQNAFGATTSPTAPGGGTTTPPADGPVYVGPKYGLGSIDVSATVSLGSSHVITITHDSHYCFVSDNHKPEAQAAFFDYWDEPTQKLTIVPKIIGEMRMRVICELRNSVSFNGYNLDLNVVR